MDQRARWWCAPCRTAGPHRVVYRTSHRGCDIPGSTLGGHLIMAMEYSRPTRCHRVGCDSKRAQAGQPLGELSNHGADARTPRLATSKAPGAKLNLDFAGVGLRPITRALHTLINNTIECVRVLRRASDGGRWGCGRRRGLMMVARDTFLGELAAVSMVRLPQKDINQAALFHLLVYNAQTMSFCRTISIIVLQSRSYNKTVALC